MTRNGREVIYPLHLRAVETMGIEPTSDSLQGILASHWIMRPHVRLVLVLASLEVYDLRPLSSSPTLDSCAAAHFF